MLERLRVVVTGGVGGTPGLTGTLTLLRALEAGEHMSRKGIHPARQVNVFYQLSLMMTRFSKDCTRAGFTVAILTIIKM